MKPFRFIVTLWLRLGRWLGWFSSTPTGTRRSRPRRQSHREFEIERLDRIRHPEKYLGRVEPEDDPDNETG